MSKTIIITGAGEGLGRTLARRFAQDGDRIVTLGRTLSKVEAVAEEVGNDSFAVGCDVGDAASVAAAFETISEKCDGVDALINNAALFDPFTLADVSAEQVVGMINTNFTGPILCSRAALPLLKKRAGRIVNVSSESVRLRFAMQWLYTATKAGLEKASDMLDRELAPDGVRVTSVRCGQMYDESKTGSNWPQELAMRFMQENLKVGIDLRTRPISHYKSVAEVFHTVVNAPADMHFGHVEINGDRPFEQTSEQKDQA